MIAQIHRQGEGEHAQDYLWFYCGGCKTHHQVPVTGPRQWAWNGSVEAPTLSPSILVKYDFVMDHIPEKICHSYVTDGRIQYLGDCTHALAGQTVPLEELP
jgi:hypothetical protein